MLYTSENSSLAYLENLVNFEDGNIPPNLRLALFFFSLPPVPLIQMGFKYLPTIRGM